MQICTGILVRFSLNECEFRRICICQIFESKGYLYKALDVNVSVDNYVLMILQGTWYWVILLSNVIVLFVIVMRS